MSFLDVLLGRPIATEEDTEQRIGVAAGVPTFGLDALGSAAYGPEAALTILIPVGALGLAYIMPLSLTIVALLAIVYFSYRQTIDAYPKGGGSYTVASENLGRNVGLLAAAALMIDYLLDVGVGISTGVGALVSAVPSLVPHTLGLCLGILLILTIISLRGTREGGFLYMLPTLLFIVCLLGVLGWGTLHAFLAGGHPVPAIPPPPAQHATEALGAWLLIRTFASGCTALTGVEAVSNGVMAFREPTNKNARRTLAAIVGLLAVFLIGIAHLTRVYGIVATDPGKPGYQSLLSMITAAIFGRGVIYYITIASVLIVLSLSANTAFADFPRLCRAIAEDGYLPRFFAIRGRRLVFTEGIVVLAILSALLLVAFGGVTDRLIPLFAIGAFLAFTLSQAGMVMHWRRTGGKNARLYMAINLIGAIATGCTVAIVLAAKFLEGAWITVLAVPLLILLMRAVHRHYQDVEARTRLTPAGLNLAAQSSAPVAIVPVATWNCISEAALQFACSLTPDVQVLHVKMDEEQCNADDWQRELDTAAARSGVKAPQVVAVDSPYRFITSPVLRHVLDAEAKFPDRRIAVVVPELVAPHWYQYLLHNHRSTVLKALLLMQGSRRIVVINVPWYL